MLRKLPLVAAAIAASIAAPASAKSVVVTEQAIRAKMSELLAVAAAEVKAGT